MTSVMQDLGSLTPEQEKKILLEASMAELVEADEDFIFFLDYVYISEPPQAGSLSEGGRVKFAKWPHLMELAHQLHRPWAVRKQGLEVTPEDRQTVVGKARQLGFSWCVAAYNVWLVFTKQGSVCPMTSQGELEAVDLLKKAKYIYDNLPELWKAVRTPKGRSDSAGEMVLWDMDSTIRALPSTQKAGRSATGTCVTIDEADFHEYLAENMAAIKPVIDAGGQIVMGSTVDKQKATSYFQSTVRNAESLGWKLLFFPYSARPGRDEKWYESTRNAIPDEELKGMSREQYMEQEYPRSLEEMLSPPRAIGYFDYDILLAMQKYCKTPIKTDGYINFYRLFQGGRKYIAGSDIATGRGGEGDYSVTVVLDITRPTVEVVADIVSNTIDIDDFVDESVRLLEEYKHPMWVIENNGVGEGAARKAADMYYTHRLYRENTKKIQGGTSRKRLLPGLTVTQSNRANIWNELRGGVNRGELIVPNVLGIRHMQDTIVPAERKGRSERPEARARAHDDYPAALAVAWYVKDSVYNSSHKEGVAVPSMW